MCFGPGGRLRGPLTAASGSFGQVRTGALAGTELVQYCAPQDESPDAHRFYCRNEG